MSRQKVQYGTSSDYSEGLMGEIQRLIAPPNEEYKKKPPNPFKRGSRQNHDTCDSCGEAGNLICCDYCAASFHLTCFDPPLEESDIPMGIFLCHTCTMKEKIAQEKKEREKANAKDVVEVLEQPSTSGVESQKVPEEQSTTECEVKAEIDTKGKDSESSTETLTPSPETESPSSGMITPSFDSEQMQVDEESTTTSLPIAGKEISVEPSKEDQPMDVEPITSKEEVKKDETPPPVTTKIYEEVVTCEITEAVSVVEPEKEEELSPLQELIRVARLLNPKQFELPVEMIEPFPFPGTERVEVIKNGRRVKNKRIIELDVHGCVPLPAKLCYSCSKSCKKAPLISCDYCTLFFHQDCLDPPMTALPAGRWMCPNHPQHFIDWHLVSSISATERMKVWDQYGNDPIDHEVVKLQFFRKAHTANPPFRTKLKPKPRDEVEIPEIIRYHYENPPSLLPSLRDVLRVDNLRKRGTVHVDSQKADVAQADEDLQAIESARKRLKNIFSDQDDVHGLLLEPEKEIEDVEVPEKLNRSRESTRRSKRSKSLAKDLETSIEEIKMEIEEEEQAKKDENPEALPVIIETSRTSIGEKEMKQEVDETKKPQVEAAKGSSLLQASELQAINDQLCNLNEDAIKLLAFQRLQQIVNENPNFIQKFQDKSVASQTVTDIAKWDIHRFPIPFPNVVNDDTVDEKANMPTVRMRERPFHMRNEGEKAHSLALSLERPLVRSKIRSRAVMTFVNDYLSGRVWFSVAPSLNLSVNMRYRSFAVGYGADNDLDLSRFGSCANVSPKHANIFYDDVTKQFEMLNYSEFGTEVNGQLFSCDFTEHPKEISETPTSPLKDKRVAIQSKIKNMLDAKKKIREGLEKSENEVTMAADEAAVCECKGRCPMIAGWEGTALLQHGYLLKFGCLSFVFSVAEYDSGNDSES